MIVGIPAFGECCDALYKVDQKIWR